MSFDENVGDYDRRHVKRRQTQTAELVDFVKSSSTHRVRFLALDSNNHPHVFDRGQHRFDPEQLSPEYVQVRDGLQMVDSYHEIHRLSESRAVTYDTKNNPYAKGGLFADLPGEFIDYIFANSDECVRVVDSELVFTRAPISDHYGELSQFELNPDCAAEN